MTPVMASTWRGLSIRQPWAAAILHSGKRVENRRGPVPARWALPFPIALHASKRPDTDRLAEFIAWGGDPDRLAYGAIVGTALVVDCHRAEGHPESACVDGGDWSVDQPGVWHWVLDGVQALGEPVPCKGSLVLGWALPDGLARRLPPLPDLALRALRGDTVSAARHG